jgi:hypothetical protein
MCKSVVSKQPLAGGAFRKKIDIDSLPTIVPNREIESEVHRLVAGKFQIAVDTEFHQRHTLLVQTAMLRGKEIVVQLYRSPSIPNIKPAEVEAAVQVFLATISFAAGLSFRLLPIKVLHKHLSPLQILCDLLELDRPATCSRAEGAELQRRQKPAFSVDIQFVGHFFAADLLRIFGSSPIHKLLNRSDEHAVDLSATALPGFVEKSRRFAGANMTNLAGKSATKAFTVS